MKILHITESNSFSGGVNQALYLARILKEKGIENYFACPENSILKNKAKDEFIFFNFKPDGSFDFKTMKIMAELFDKYKFDVVHAHHPKAHSYGLWGKKLSKFKPVFVVSRRVSHPIPKNPYAQIKYKSKDVNAFIAVCDAVKKILVNYGINEEKIYVVYSGVDTKRFKPQPRDLEFKKSLGVNEDDFVISHVGNFSNEKGQIYLIKAAKILYDKGYNFKLLFAGVKTDSQELKDLFIKNNIPLSKGIFLGLRNDVEKILNITDISINASVKGEALSGSIRESLACGVPVIASDISGNSEIVKNDFNGFLFKPGNFTKLAEKIEILINNKKLRKKFSQNAILTIDEKFTVEKMAEETLSIYKKYLSTH